MPPGSKHLYINIPIYTYSKSGEQFWSLRQTTWRASHWCQREHWAGAPRWPVPWQVTSGKAKQEVCVRVRGGRDFVVSLLFEGRISWTLRQKKMFLSKKKKRTHSNLSFIYISAKFHKESDAQLKHWMPFQMEISISFLLMKTLYLWKFMIYRIRLPPYWFVSSFLMFWISCLTSAKFAKDVESWEITKALQIPCLSSEQPLGGCARRARPCQQLWEGEAAAWVHQSHAKEFTQETDIMQHSSIWRFSIRELNNYKFRSIGKQWHEVYSL